jgi:hypothetical protein
LGVFASQGRVLSRYGLLIARCQAGSGGIMDIRVTLTLILATVFVGQAQAATNAWDGFVTDTHCGTNCQRTSAMTPDRACVRLCVRKGSKFGLWYGNHVYTLEPQSKAARYAAERVRVIGELSDDVIRITSIVRIPAASQPEPDQ